MQEQQQQVEAKKKSRSKSPTSIRGLKREKSVTNNTAQPKQAPTAIIHPVGIQAHEEVKASQAVLSSYQGELEKLKF